MLLSFLKSPNATLADIAERTLHTLLTVWGTSLTVRADAVVGITEADASEEGEDAVKPALLDSSQIIALLNRGTTEGDGEDASLINSPAVQMRGLRYVEQLPIISFLISHLSFLSFFLSLLFASPVASQSYELHRLPRHRFGDRTREYRKLC